MPSQVTQDIRKLILNRATQSVQRVFIKMLGCEVGFRTLSAKDAFLLLAGSRNEDGRLEDERFAPALVIATLCDPETGERVLSAPDRDSVLETDYPLLNELVDGALTANAMKGKTENELLKNSSRTESSEPTSSSQNGSGAPSSN